VAELVQAYRKDPKDSDDKEAIHLANSIDPRKHLRKARELCGQLVIDAGAVKLRKPISIASPPCQTVRSWIELQTFEPVLRDELHCRLSPGRAVCPFVNSPWWQTVRRAVPQNHHERSKPVAEPASLRTENRDSREVARAQRQVADPRRKCSDPEFRLSCLYEHLPTLALRPIPVRLSVCPHRRICCVINLL
jgi:hypothetical protein